MRIIWHQLKYIVKIKKEHRYQKAYIENKQARESESENMSAWKFTGFYMTAQNEADTFIDAVFFLVGFGLAFVQNLEWKLADHALQMEEKRKHTKKCACSKCRWIIKKAYEKPQANIPLRTHTHISSTPNEVSTLDSCSRSPRPFVRQILNFIQNALGGNVGWSWSHLMIVYFPFRKSRPVFFCCLPLPSFTGHI